MFEKEDFKFLASFENERQGIEKTLSGIFYGTRASPDSQRAAHSPRRPLFVIYNGWHGAVQASLCRRSRAAALYPRLLRAKMPARWWEKLRLGKRREDAPTSYIF